MTQRTQRLSRRSFLMAAGAGGAATAAAIVARTADPRAARKQDGRRASRGYHASEHINNYYRTTKV